MSQETEPVREKFKFVGREIVDGVPHLVWAPVKPKADTVDEPAGSNDPAAASDDSDEAWGCTVEEFRQITTGTGQLV